jgi:hypothetical protein
MQQANGVAELATHLIRTDRRALSQAWYSALHLADRTPRARPALPARPSAFNAQARPCASSGSREQPQGGALRDVARAQRAATRTPGSSRREHCPSEAERRAANTALARRTQRAAAQQPQPGGPFSFAVRAADGGVQLLVRGGGGCTRVLAVCAPALRERVERALASARLALARGGVRAEAA